MQEHEVVRFVSRLPGVVAVTASEASGAPEVAWGDSFFSYDPQGVAVGRQRFQEVLGFAPAEHSDRSDGMSTPFSTRSFLTPSTPPQGWVSIVSPGVRTSDEARALIVYAHRRAMDRYDPAAAGP